MSLLTKAGITKLSELQVDTDKNWQGRGISNLKELAPGMTTGDLVQHDGARLARLSPGGPSMVLTSQGPNKVVVWAPGGTYLYRFFPVMIALSHDGGLFTPDRSKALSASLGTQIITAPPNNRVFTPTLASVLAEGLFAPDATKSINPALTKSIQVQAPVSAALLNKGGDFTDYIAQAKSAYQKDQGDTGLGFTLDQQQTNDNADWAGDSVTWLAQTFTPAISGYITKVSLKLFKTGSPVTGTVSIKAVDGNGKPTGADLCSMTFNAALLGASPGSMADYIFSTPAWLTAGRQYALCLSDTSAGGSNDIHWRMYFSNLYTGGLALYSPDSGITWTADANKDAVFQTYYQADGDNGDVSVSGNNWEAQTFTAGITSTLRYLLFKLWFSNDPGTVTVSIRATDGLGHPTGADLTGMSFSWSSILAQNLNGRGFLGSPGGLLRLDFATPVAVVNGTKYAIVVRASNGNLNLRKNSSAPYVSGNREYSSNGGGSWTSDNAVDYIFEEWYTLNDFKLLPDAALNIGDEFYWGYDQPFDGIIQDIGVAGQGSYILVFSYSRVGDFNPCVGLVDGTNKFQHLYSNQITHTRQGDFAAQTVNGISKYWIKATVTDAGSGYGQPLGTFAAVLMNL